AIASNGRLQLVDLVIKPIRGVRILGAALAGDDRPDIEAVDRVPGQLSADEFGNRREKVEAHEHLFAFSGGGDFAGPAHDARFARATFPTSAFALAQRIGSAGMIAVGQPGAIVGGEDDPGIAGNTSAVQSIQYLADRPIDLLDDVA